MIQPEQILNSFHVEDIKNPHHPPSYIKESEYEILILRLLHQKDAGLSPHSYAFVFTKESIYRFDHQTQLLIAYEDFTQFYKTLDKAVDETLGLMQKLHERIETLEDALMGTQKTKEFIKQWFVLKKEASVAGRVLSLSSPVLKGFQNGLKSQSKQTRLQMHDMYEHLQRSARLSMWAGQKLESLFNLHDSLANEALNKKIYLLTILSAIFLPLNLVVGFFGMNTQDLYLVSHQDGTDLIVVSLLGIVTLSILLLLLVNKKINKG